MSEEKKVEQDERGAFEAWFKVERKRPESFIWRVNESDAWEIWQARAASTSANVAQHAEAGWDAKGIKLTHSQRVAISQFLSDVMTAAGLVSHGKQCKALGERLGERCMALHTLLDGQSATPLAMPSEEEVIAAAEYNWSTVSFDENGDSIYHFEKDYLQRFAKRLFAAAEEKQYASADAIDAEIHRLLELKIERFPEYAKSLLEGYATKVEVFDHMIKVAQAAGFESLTEAISVAKKSRANVAQGAEAVAFKLLAALIDILDDADNNAPEDRCYVEGAWKEALDEARSLIDERPIAKSSWHPDFVTAMYENSRPDKLYTMDQMREYADAFHRSRIDAALTTAQSGDKS